MYLSTLMYQRISFVCLSNNFVLMNVYFCKVCLLQVYQRYQNGINFSELSRSGFSSAFNYAIKNLLHLDSYISIVKWNYRDTITGRSRKGRFTLDQGSLTERLAPKADCSSPVYTYSIIRLAS